MRCERQTVLTMKTLSFLPGRSPVGPSRSVPVERFTRSTRVYSVWLLSDVVCHWVHFPKMRDDFHLGTTPCVDGAHCRECAEPGRFWRRIEGYAPALLYEDQAQAWIHIVAVFTAGAVKQLPQSPQRGHKLEIVRQKSGDSRNGRLKIRTQSDKPVQPPADPFDMSPWLLAMWYPNSTDLPEAEAPEPIQTAVFRPAEPEPVRLPPEIQVARYKDAIARHHFVIAETIASGYREQFGHEIPGYVPKAGPKIEAEAELPATSKHTRRVLSGVGTAEGATVRYTEATAEDRSKARRILGELAEGARVHVNGNGHYVEGGAK